MLFSLPFLYNSLATLISITHAQTPNELLRLARKWRKHRVTSETSDYPLHFGSDAPNTKEIQ